ncbi:capsid protein [Ruminococcus sp. TM10-9AT]|nr:capsid protein [Ruminococcus sp. TM10-9AT]
MGWMQKLNETIKHSIRSWLNIMPASPYAIQIDEIMDFELNAIRNRIWYSADGNKIEQMYRQMPEYADKQKFWSSRCTPGMEMRKIHTGLPSLIVRVLNSIIIAGMEKFEFPNVQQEQLWNEIEEDNKFRKKFEKSLKETLFIGDGAYKISVDTELSQYPILEWYPGERIEIVLNRERLKEIVFKQVYMEGKRQYVLNEHYGYGYIIPRLYKGETEVPLNTLEETANMKPVTFDKSVILAVPFKIYESSQFEGRGGSIFDGKLDAFDAFDEAWSQWMDALRAGRARTYIPESYIPRDPENGVLMRPNPFDNRFIAGDDNMSENGKNEIHTEQPAIPHESYLASYCTALDLCLQGIISPSTLGIDVKKLDNADAQREKEKTTLYTRDAIIEALQETLPELIETAVNAYHILHNEIIEEVKVNIKFKEYANPSFESQVETVAKAKQGGIMSIERCVEELYGDSLDDHCKQEEITRLKAEQGIQELDEPSVSMAAGDFQVDTGGEGTNEGKGNEPDLQDGSKGVSGASGNSKGAGTSWNLRSGKR